MAGLSDLNNHLHEQLTRLGNSSLKGEALNEEIERSKAITTISKEIISNARTALAAEELKIEYGLTRKLPDLIGG